MTSHDTPTRPVSTVGPLAALPALALGAVLSLIPVTLCLIPVLWLSGMAVTPGASRQARWIAAVALSVGAVVGGLMGHAATSVVMPPASRPARLGALGGQLAAAWVTCLAPYPALLTLTLATATGGVAGGLLAEARRLGRRGAG
jgi:hypothetical protein